MLVTLGQGKDRQLEEEGFRSRTDIHVLRITCMKISLSKGLRISIIEDSRCSSEKYSARAVPFSGCRKESGRATVETQSSGLSCVLHFSFGIAEHSRSIVHLHHQ